ncbi:MAG: hypothetical protein HC770_10945 [Pseudanabaena sp. CRU_2_10]|nr:hypothetical protein [Pseudanabaena sp. CRU_2_10]
MTQTPEPQSEIQRAIQPVLDRLDTLTLEMDDIRHEQKESNIRIDAYQKASNQVVNLAFTVITAAAAVTILSPAVKAVAEYFTR